ncbi:MAG: rubrerythrin family protein [Sulfurospirillaceae bacterium]|jgi:desulfoferrodoxin-like iron-binding protein|nr:rubrerythrin family protein [Sulfurospirillaceae bacterium]MCK9546397.1 rubrerythrin family protein [Sulfurospirillaceae bacterium]NLM99271.1 rubrerythrin family protein [Campylobacteraceae bacterium]
MRQYETYKCETCGNEVEVQVVGGGKLSCCGKEMKCITENLTAVNLMKAFAGESMARNKYDLFADMAEEEGLHRIAVHFREAALNEMWHARAQFKEYNKMIHGFELDTTAKNLLYAADGERYEHETMYPDFEAIAKEEGHSAIARLFKAIGRVEVEHEREYLALKQMLDDEGFFESEVEDTWVCEVCGHVHRGKKAPGACPLCRVGQEYFKREFLG